MSKLKHQNHAKILRLIRKLQVLHAYENVTDPVAWQRALRKDRQLPDRL